MFSTLHWLIHNLLVDFRLSQDELCSRNWTSPIVVFTRRVYKLAIKKTELPNTRPLRSPVANESNLTRLKGLSFSLCAPVVFVLARDTLCSLSPRADTECVAVCQGGRGWVSAERRSLSPQDENWIIPMWSSSGASNLNSRRKRWGNLRTVREQVLTFKTSSRWMGTTTRNKYFGNQSVSSWWFS